MRVFGILCLLIFSQLSTISAEPLTTPIDTIHTQEQAVKFNQHAKGALAPVYPYLAEYIVEQFDLSQRSGIGVDLGSGPGDLILELAKRTQKIYWINADINPHHFPFFYQDIAKANLTHRAGAIFADAQVLPFRDNYANIIISRGSFQFWENKKRAFSEIYRVLKPGGSAFIGRGLSPKMPLEAARSARTKQKGGPKYDLDKTEHMLRSIMSDLNIQTYNINRPKVSTDVNYGIWITITKPVSNEQ